MISELLTLVPALWITYKYLLPSEGPEVPMVRHRNKISDTDRDELQALLVVFMTMLNPALILIDHGHFQYNHVALAFCQLGLIFLSQTLTEIARSSVRKNDLFGKHGLLKYGALTAVSYACALCFKQMSLYFAPCFGCLMLTALWQDYRMERQFAKTILETFGILLSGLLVFIISIIPLVRQDVLQQDLSQG